MTEKEIELLPNLLTVSETAKVLRIGRNATYELVWQKKIPVITFGPKKIRVPKEELLKWIKNNTQIYQVQ